MAFIRWKPNGAGGRHAYLVHAYRGEDGKPKQKVLAYLGDNADLTPERMAQLRERHTDLAVQWDKIKPVNKPVINFAALSDAELLRKMRELRLERGLNTRRMVWRLEEHGLPECSGPDSRGAKLSARGLGVLEKALERGEPQEHYLDPESEVAPVLRRFLSSLGNVQLC